MEIARLMAEHVMSMYPRPAAMQLGTQKRPQHFGASSSAAVDKCASSEQLRHHHVRQSPKGFSSQAPVTWRLIWGGGFPWALWECQPCWSCWEASCSLRRPAA